MRHDPYRLIWMVPPTEDVSDVLTAIEAYPATVRLAGTRLVAYTHLPRSAQFRIFYKPLDGLDHYHGQPIDLTPAQHLRVESRIVWRVDDSQCSQWGWLREYQTAQTRPTGRPGGRVGRYDVVAYSELPPDFPPDKRGRWHRRAWCLCHCPHLSRVEGQGCCVDLCDGGRAVCPRSIEAGEESGPAVSHRQLRGSTRIALQTRRDYWLRRRAEGHCE